MLRGHPRLPGNRPLYLGPRIKPATLPLQRTASHATKNMKHKKKILLSLGIIAILVFLWIILTDPFPSQEERLARRQVLTARQTASLVEEFISEYRNRPNIRISCGAVKSFWGMECTYFDIEKAIAPYAFKRKNRESSAWYETKDEIVKRLGEEPYQNLMLVRLNAPEWIVDYPDHKQTYQELFQTICDEFPYQKTKYPIVFYLYYGPSFAEGV